MTEETRNQKALRELNEEIARDREAYAGMSPEEKRALRIAAAVTAVFVLIVAAVLYFVILR